MKRVKTELLGLGNLRLSYIFWIKSLPLRIVSKTHLARARRCAMQVRRKLKVINVPLLPIIKHDWLIWILIQLIAHPQNAERKRMHSRYANLLRVDGWVQARTKSSNAIREFLAGRTRKRNHVYICGVNTLR